MACSRQVWRQLRHRPADGRVDPRRSQCSPDSEYYVVVLVESYSANAGVPRGGDCESCLATEYADNDDSEVRRSVDETAEKSHRSPTGMWFTRQLADCTRGAQGDCG